ncbi:MAG: LysM peptidoglycan-binding domain-containing protein [Trueperaceae bacterium]|nr:LysM peptidoglycan-binding domain-containing protein [Trueperaceae bacterium]
MRRTTTNYPGGEKSTQVHGMEWSPLALDGTWNDGWTQTPGWAQDQKQTALELMTAGHIVRCDYDTESVWGVFDVEIKERTRVEIRYEITFQPLAQEPPEYQATMRFESTPGEDLAAIDETLTQLDAEANVTAPSEVEVNDAWETELFLRTQRTLNAWGDLNAQLSGVESYDDLGTQQAAQIQRQALRTLSISRKLTGRTQSVPITKMAAAGPSRLYAQNRAMQVERRALTISRQVLDLIRRIALLRQPRDKREYVVGEGDTLISIAAKQLGDWTRWERIATMNDLDFPGQVSVGDVLVLPGE